MFNLSLKVSALMGNCLTLPSAAAKINLSKKNKALPIETIFKLPSPIPVWPKGISNQYLSLLSTRFLLILVMITLF
jgi:hypothetical protein